MILSKLYLFKETVMNNILFWQFFIRFLLVIFLTLFPFFSFFYLMLAIFSQDQHRVQKWRRLFYASLILILLSFIMILYYSLK